MSFRWWKRSLQNRQSPNAWIVAGRGSIRIDTERAYYVGPCSSYKQSYNPFKDCNNTIYPFLFRDYFTLKCLGGAHLALSRWWKNLWRFFPESLEVTGPQPLSSGCSGHLHGGLPEPIAEITLLHVRKWINGTRTSQGYNISPFITMAPARRIARFRLNL